MLFRRERHPIAPYEQTCDLALAVERALALHLGRMSGQYRRDERLREPACDVRTADADQSDPLERVGDAAAFRCRTGQRLRTAAPALVHVLGDVDEMGKIAERPHDVE